MSKKRIILASKINPLNFSLYFLASFFYQIKAYEIYPAFLSRFKFKIELLNLEDYFDRTEFVLIRSNAVKTANNLLIKLLLPEWQARIKKTNLNLIKKAKQDLQKEIEKLHFLIHILRIFEKENKVYIIGSIDFSYLSKIDKNSSLFAYPSKKFFSGVSIFLDRVNFMVINLIRFAKVIHQFIRGIFFNKQFRGKIKFIYDGISIRELSTEDNEISYTWLIDNQAISKKDILFILPKADFEMSEHADDFKKDKELLAVERSDLLTFASYKKLYSCLPEVFRMLISVLLPRLSFSELTKLKYLIDILKWLPLVESLGPKVYLVSECAMNTEDPVIIYFNNLGVKTVMWTYSVNSYPFLTDSSNGAFLYTFDYNNVISENLLVWNRDFKEFVDRHLQGNESKVKVIGPLMSGDENVLKDSKKLLSQKLGKPYNDRIRYIALFDVPPLTSDVQERKRSSVRYIKLYSYGYNDKFVKDIYRLLSEFQNIGLIYKPKRHLTSGVFYYSNELKSIFNDMQNNPNVIFLNYNDNPWIPIALADMCISVPFGSPTIAALHYGKPAIFYDPLGIVYCDRYAGINKYLLAADFNQLKNKVKEFLFDPKANSVIYRNEEILNFTGAAPGENSSHKFRGFLQDLAKS